MALLNLEDALVSMYYTGTIKILNWTNKNTRLSVNLMFGN